MKGKFQMAFPDTPTPRLPVLFWGWPKNKQSMDILLDLDVLKKGRTILYPNFPKNALFSHSKITGSTKNFSDTKMVTIQ